MIVIRCLVPLVHYFLVLPPLFTYIQFPFLIAEFRMPLMSSQAGSMILWNQPLRCLTSRNSEYLIIPVRLSELQGPCGPSFAWYPADKFLSLRFPRRFLKSQGSVFRVVTLCQTGTVSPMVSQFESLFLFFPWSSAWASVWSSLKTVCRPSSVLSNQAVTHDPAVSLNT